MRNLRVKVTGLLLIYLAASLELISSLTFSRVLAQESYEDFLDRLEGYLNDALPSESEPMEECEYIVPEGFDPSQAEILWRTLAPFVSLGHSDKEIRDLLPNSTLQVEVNGSVVALNLTGLCVERLGNGTVKVKIPVATTKPLNYTYHNSTNARIFYEVWNETLLRYYKVERVTDYNITYRDLETGRTYSVLSKLGFEAFPRETLTLPEGLEVKELNWGTIAKSSHSPVIAVPGHYEDIRVLMPEHEESFKVLFPAYDPAVYTGWLVDIKPSSTSLTLGETLYINYSAFPEGIDPSTEPLDANLSLEVPDAFEVLGESSVHLDNLNRNGSFELKALQPGTYNVTLRLCGNACFDIWPTDKELSLMIQVVAPLSPSVSVSILSVDTSVLKHAKLTVEIRNNGGSTAKNVFVEVTGSNVNSVSRNLEDLEVGVAREELFSSRLLKEHSNIIVKVGYRDEANNSYLVMTSTSIWSKNFFVPEHFEEYTVMIPEHFDTLRVFVPGYEGYTHVRFYAAYSLAVANPRIYAPAALMFPGIVLEVPTFELTVGKGTAFETKYSYGKTLSALSLYLIPSPLPGFELEVSKEQSIGRFEEMGVNFMVQSIEPHWEPIGVLDETRVSSLIGVGTEELRSGSIPSTYRVEGAGSVWIPGKRILLNSTEFLTYKERMEELLEREGETLASELRWNFTKFVNATRDIRSVNESGHVVMIYHPVSIKGGGALKSIQVKNYAGINVSYTMRVYQYRQFAYQSYAPLQELCSKPFSVIGGGYNVTLASSLASTGYEYRIELLYGPKLVAEAVFDLHPEQSPFWSGFWDGMREKLPGIIVSSAIIVVTACLSGGGTAATYASLAISIGAMLFHLAYGTWANFQEVMQAAEISSHLESFSEYYARFSYELSNYTPYEESVTTWSLVEGQTQKKAFKPKGPIAEVLWEYSKAYSEAASKIKADTGLDMILGVGISDFEAVLNPNADEYRKGYSCGRITGTALSIVSFVLATRIATELRPKIEGFSSNMWSFTGSLKAWLTPSVYDLAETLVKGRRTITWMVKHPGEALYVARLSVLSALEEVKGKTLELWSSIKGKVKDMVKRAESYVDEEDCHRSLEEAMKELEVGGKLAEGVISLSKNIDQEKVVDLLYSFDEAKVSTEEQAKALEDLNAILNKDREAESKVADWLIFEFTKVKSVEEFRELSVLLPKVRGLDSSAMKNLGDALSQPDVKYRGVELLEVYFKTTELKQYGKDVADTLTGAVLKNHHVLDVWTKAVERGAEIMFSEAVATAKDGAQLQVSGRVESGYYWVQAVNRESGKLMEDVRRIEEGQHAVYFKGASYGETYVLILTKTNPGETLTLLRVGDNTLLNYFEKTYGLTLVIDGEDVYLRTPDGYLVKVDAELEGISSNIYVKLELTDSRGEEHVLHIGDEGSLSIIFKDTHTSVNRVYQKTVKDDSGSITARLMYIKYMSGFEESTERFAFSSNPPGRPVYFLDNSERFIEVEPGQGYLEFREVLNDILGKDGYEDLVNDMREGKAVVGVAYVEGGEKKMKWTTSTRMELEVKGIEEVLGVAVARMNGLGAKAGETGLGIKIDEEGVKQMLIDAPGISKSFEVENIAFKKPKGDIINLVVTLKSG
ncbi:MAG: hypothetical protein QXF26_04560, partial [Candidatus Bathyarchaeia archaeon]